MGHEVFRLADEAFPGKRRPQAPNHLPLPILLEGVAKATKSVWAPSTWQQRLRLWRRLTLWCQTHQPPISISPLAAAFFVQSLTKVSQSSKATYASALAAVFKLLRPEIDATPLHLFGRGLKLGDLGLPAGAVPMREEDVLAVQASRSPLSVPLLLAWKAASRLSEVMRLTVDHVLSVENGMVVIFWGKLPKGRRRMPHQPSAFVVLTGRFVPRIRDYVMARMALRRSRRAPPPVLFPWTSTKIVSHLRETTSRPRLTGHSAKKGAADRLLAIEPPVCAVLLGRLLKHRSDCEPFPTVTCRYGSRVRLAHHLRTAELTDLL